MNELAVGVDIGGTNIKYGIVNRRGKILKKGALKTKDFPTAEGFLESLHNALMPQMMEFGIGYQFRGIGIGAPNGNYNTGNIEYAPNLAWKGIVPLSRLTSEIFGLPSVLTNDANAAAAGEMMYGAAKGMKDCIVITLGTGVGSGIIANGKLVTGHDGFAGELGHTIIRPGGRKHWSTNLKGSVEAYCSATGIAITAAIILSQSTMPSLLRKYSSLEIDSKVVCECALQGDELAIEVYRFTGQILGEALANFIMFSSPQAIILFGGVTKAEKLLMDPVREHMEANLLPIFQNKVKVMCSELHEADAAILGSSSLVWEMCNEAFKVGYSVAVAP